METTTTALLAMTRGFLRWNKNAGAAILLVHLCKLWGSLLLGTWFLERLAVKER
jgi:hypothetical protein